MSKTPPQNDKPEDEGFREFQETVRKMLNTPHQPHAPSKKGPGPKPRPKR